MPEQEQDYEARADEAKREAARMEVRSEQVGEQVEDARKDWETKKHDSKVPGAAGDPDRAAAGGRHPETAYPAKGPDDELSSPDPTDNDDSVVDAPRD